MKESKKIVLIVDDDPLVANLYKGKLESAGYAVETASDGQKGFAKIQDFKPDVVLLDLILPEISGVEVLNKIRAEPDLKDLPVVVFSNAFATMLVSDAMKAGATRVLNKAESSPLQVLACLREVLLPKRTDVRSGLGGGARRETSETTALFAKAPRPSAGVPLSPSPAGAAASAPLLPPPSALRSEIHATTLPSPTPGPVRADPPAVSAPQAKAPAPPPSGMPTLGAVDAGTSDEFESSLRDEFFADGPATIGFLRKQLGILTKETTDLGRADVLLTIYRKIAGITGNAGVVGLSIVSQICSVLESFLKELEQKPSNLNASTLRTIAQTVDFLAVLFEKKGGAVVGEDRQPCVLVVDDETISRRAVVFALNKARVASVDLSDPQMALDKATAMKFDLIYLDVEMPVMNGFELCSRIRADTQNKTTPVVFITGLSDFESRARSTLSGGNDLIAKPFMFIELAVKSLTYIMKGRLAGGAAGTKRS